MKLESLKLEKFSSSSLNKEQMFNLRGGLLANTRTGSGRTCGYTNGYYGSFDYGYDVDRGDGEITIMTELML